MLTRQNIIMRSCVLGALLLALAYPAIAQSVSKSPYVLISKPHPDLVASVNGTISEDTVDRSRVFCMSGGMSTLYEELLKQNKRPTAAGRTTNPPAGQKCTALLETAANAEKSTETLKKTPTLALLSPYGAVLGDKGFGNDVKGKIAVVNLYASKSSSAEGDKIHEPIYVPLNNGNRFIITQGSALDSNFVKTVLDATANPPIAAQLPTKKTEDLLVQAEACFRNQGITIKACAEVGRELATNFLLRTKK